MFKIFLVFAILGLVLALGAVALVAAAAVAAAFGVALIIKALKQRHAAAPEVPADLADLPDDADLAL